MISGLAKISLFAGVPMAGIMAYGVYSHYSAIADCSKLRGNEGDACYLSIAKAMPEPTLETAMYSCWQAEQFMILYKVDERTQRRYHKEDVEERYKQACQK